MSMRVLLQADDVRQSIRDLSRYGLNLRARDCHRAVTARCARMTTVRRPGKGLHKGLQDTEATEASRVGCWRTAPAFESQGSGVAAKICLEFTCNWQLAVKSREGLSRTARVGEGSSCALPDRLSTVLAVFPHI